MPTLGGAAVDDAAATGAGSGLGATGIRGGGGAAVGVDGLTGAGVGEAAGRGAIDVTAERGDAMLEAPIVTRGGAFLAGSHALWFCLLGAGLRRAPRCGLRGRLLGLHRLLGRLLRRRGFAGLSVGCGYRFDGVLGGRLALLLLRCLRCPV